MGIVEMLCMRWQSDVQDEALMERAEWCRRYAQINAVALRKVRGSVSGPVNQLCVLWP